MLRGMEYQNFINILTHELKTPLLAQMNILKMLYDGAFGNLNSEQEDMIKMTMESCEDLLDMVKTVLVNYKLENGDIILNTESVNLMEIVEECCCELSEYAEEKRLKLELHPANRNIKIYADKDLLRQAIFNVIANSITYAHSDTVFCIRINNTDLNACISVASKGKHLPNDVLEGLFDYYSGNFSTYTKIGFGLKLCLALRIVKAHMGGIIARNSKSDEIVFDIVLPIFNPKSAIIRFDKKINSPEHIPA